MEQLEKTRIGRPLFRSKPDKADQNFTPNQRHVAWMKFINLHGPQSSEYLYQYTKPQARCYDTAKRALKALWQGGMVHYPKQQRATDNANYHHLVYDLTERGKKYLKQNGHWAEAVRPTGPWLHQFMISTITATMHIMCERHGYRFVPAHEILQGKKLTIETSFHWTDGSHKSMVLNPDGLFAIQYADGYKSFLIEADRDTEPNVTPTVNRKSGLRSIMQYEDLNRQFKRLKKHNAQTDRRRKIFNLTRQPSVLYITTAQSNNRFMLSKLEERLEQCSFMAFGHAPDFVTNFWKPPKLMTHLFEEPLPRANRPPLTLKRDPVAEVSKS